MDLIKAANDLYRGTKEMRVLQRKYVKVRSEGRHDWNLLNDLKAAEGFVDMTLNKIYNECNTSSIPARTGSTKAE